MPWGLGCEAEPCTNMERIVASLKTPKGAKGFGIDGGCEVQQLQARSDNPSNKPVVKYINKEDQTITWGLGGVLKLIIIG